MIVQYVTLLHAGCRVLGNSGGLLLCLDPRFVARSGVNRADRLTSRRVYVLIDNCASCGNGSARGHDLSGFRVDDRQGPAPCQFLFRCDCFGVVFWRIWKTIGRCRAEKVSRHGLDAGIRHPFKHGVWCCRGSRDCRSWRRYLNTINFFATVLARGFDTRFAINHDGTCSNNRRLRWSRLCCRLERLVLSLFLDREVAPRCTGNHNRLSIFSNNGLIWCTFCDQFELGKTRHWISSGCWFASHGCA